MGKHLLSALQEREIPNVSLKIKIH